MAELQQQLTEAKVNGKRVRAAPTFNVRVGQAAHDFSGAQDSSYWAQLLTHCAQQALDEEQAS